MLQDCSRYSRNLNSQESFQAQPKYKISAWVVNLQKIVINISHQQKKETKENIIWIMESLNSLSHALKSQSHSNPVQSVHWDTITLLLE